MILKSDPAVQSNRFLRRCCLFYLCALIGFWVISVSQTYVSTRLAHQSFSVKSLLFHDSEYRFSDFQFVAATRRMGSGSPSIVYPAPMMCGYVIFFSLFAAPLKAYLIFVAISAAAGMSLLGVTLASAKGHRLLLVGVVCATAVLWFPLYFLLERANMEGLLWTVSLVGLTAFLARRYTTAALLFALTASMKLYPGLLVLLLLARKRYRDLAIFLVAAAVFTLAALRVLGPSIPQAFNEMKAGVKIQNDTYLMNYRSDVLRFDHSLFAGIKDLLFIPYGHDRAALHRHFLLIESFYIPLAAAGFAACYWFWIRKLPLLNQAMSLIFLSVLLPVVSYEYTLIHVYFAWGLFLMFLARDVATGRSSISWRTAGIVLASFALIFAPALHIPIAGQLKMCALLALLLIVLNVPMHSSLLDDPEGA